MQRRFKERFISDKEETLFFWKGTAFPIKNSICDKTFGMKAGKAQYELGLVHGVSKHQQIINYRQQLDSIEKELNDINGDGRILKNCPWVKRLGENYVYCLWVQNICSLLYVGDIVNDDMNGVMSIVSSGFVL